MRPRFAMRLRHGQNDWSPSLLVYQEMTDVLHSSCSSGFNSDANNFKTHSYRLTALSVDNYERYKSQNVCELSILGAASTFY